jgi:hypothetical protein
MIKINEIPNPDAWSRFSESRAFSIERILVIRHAASNTGAYSRLARKAAIGKLDRAISETKIQIRSIFALAGRFRDGIYLPACYKPKWVVRNSSLCNY